MAWSETYNSAGDPHAGWGRVTQYFLDFVCADNDRVVCIDVPLDEVAVTTLGAKLPNDSCTNESAFTLLELLIIPRQPLLKALLVAGV